MKPNWAPSTATAMSQAAASPAPPPKATPSTSATVTAGISLRCFSIPATLIASCRLSDSVRSDAAAIHSRSPPAQKCPPAPRRKTTRTWSAAFRVSNASVSASMVSRSKALRLEGRLMVTKATPSGVDSRFTTEATSSTMTFSTRGSEMGLDMVRLSRSSRRGARRQTRGRDPGCARSGGRRSGSHPEQAEAGLRDRRVERGGDGQAQHVAGLGRIDDAVVP